MAKATGDTVLDGALDILGSSCSGVYVCTSQPTNYAQATSTYALAASTSVTSADWTGPGDAGGGGRKITFDGKSSISVASSGSAAHVAWVKASGSVLLAVTTCSTQALTAGNKVNIPGSIDFTIGDPS